MIKIKTATLNRLLALIGVGLCAIAQVAVAQVSRDDLERCERSPTCGIFIEDQTIEENANPDGTTHKFLTVVMDFRELPVSYDIRDAVVLSWTISSGTAKKGVDISPPYADSR